MARIRKKGNKKPNDYAQKGRNDSANRGKQGRKDSRSDRVNFDNERKDKFERDEANGTVAKIMAEDHSNDVTWYTRNPQLLKSGASYNFAYITGQDTGLKVAPYRVPGVCSIEWHPAYGGANINAVNQAKQANYSYQVHANSRNQSYDDSDLFIVNMAGKEIFNILAAMIRCYGTMKRYDERNMYTPEALVSVMGFDFRDCLLNLSNMWFDINSLIARATQIWVPNNMPLIARQFWMNTNVYYDSGTPKAQFYLYVQSQFYTYAEAATTTGGALLPATVVDPTGVATTRVFNPGGMHLKSGSTTVYEPIVYSWAQWVGVATQMLDNLLNSQDRGIMFGDALKAFGKENIYTINEIPSDYTIEYTYNQEVLSQFENATITGFEMAPIGLAQAPDTPGNVLVPLYRPFNLDTANSNWNGMCPSAVVLNMHKEDVTPEDVMVATRMTCAGRLSTQVTSYDIADWVKYVDDPKPENAVTLTKEPNAVNLPAATGTEVILNAVVHKLPDDSYTASLGSVKSLVSMPYRIPQDGQDSVTLSTFLAAWSAMDWAPWLYTFTKNGDNRSSQWPNNIYGDFDNYTVLTGHDVTKLHTAAVYSLLGVPYL